jgi:hypothetical protein
MSIYLTRTLLLSLGISIFLTVCFHVVRDDLKLPALIRFSNPKETYSAVYTIRANGYPPKPDLQPQFKNLMEENITSTRERLDKAGYHGEVKRENDSIYKVSAKNITDTSSLYDLVSSNGSLSFNEVYPVAVLMSGLLDLGDKWPRFSDEKMVDSANDFFGKVLLLTNSVSDASGRPYYQPYIGSVDITKAGRVLKLLSDPAASGRLPQDVQFMLGDIDRHIGLPSKYQLLYALKKNADPITKRNIAEVYADLDDENHPFVALQFDAAGARRWQILTERNIGQPIAISINDKVIIAPQVLQGISGGSSRISMAGEENCRVVSVLLSGSELKLPVRIIQSNVTREEKFSPNAFTGYINYIILFILSFVISFCVIWFVFKPGKKLSRNV